TVPQPPTQPITDATAALRRMPTGGTACVKPADPVAQFRQDLQNQYHEQLNRDVYSPNSVVLAQAAAMVFEAHLEQHQAVVAEKDRTITQLRAELERKDDLIFACHRVATIASSTIERQ